MHTGSSVVITGLGLISPYGIGSELLWEKLLQGEVGLRALSTFDTSHIQCRVGGQLLDFSPNAYLSPRTVRKMDRFSVFALIAARLALQQAQLLADDQRPLWMQRGEGEDRVGVCVGNNLGGWEFAERELRNLWSLGPREVSPYMATAWFPAAVQGNLSIQFGIKGVGRTFLSDRASGAMALIHAANCLQRGKVDIMLVGGTEAPFSPYATLCYETSGLMSQRAVSGSSAVYRPFDVAHDGLVAAEGSAFFVLEREEDALERGVPILARLTGWSSTYDGYDPVRSAPDGVRYAAAMKQALERAGRRPKDVDCIFAAGSAVPDEDVSETKAIRLAFEDLAEQIPVSTPKSAFGNMFGAATPMDMAIALLAMQRGVIPATLHLDQSAPGCDLDYVPQQPRSVERLRTCLINARGMGGTNAAFVLQH